MKYQRGYLLIVAVIIVVVVGFLGNILVNMYLLTARSTTNILQSDQAFYIAKAGLEIARRDLQTGLALSCESITDSSKFTNACYPPSQTNNCSGYFTVTGSPTNLTTTLASNITNATSTVVKLTNVSGFLPQVGIIVVKTGSNTEAITYNGISNKVLQNVKRGAFNTTAAPHPKNSSTVIQNVCSLTSTAKVPSLENPTGIRELKELLWKQSDAPSSGSVGSLPNQLTPGLAAVGGVSAANYTAIKNPEVTTNSPNFRGATIVSGETVVLNNSAKTHIANDQVSSVPGSFKNDIVLQDNIDFNSNNKDQFFGYYFRESRAQLQAKATIITDCQNHNYSNDHGVMWLACDNFTADNNITIGTPEDPLIIIATGNVNINNNVKINGFLYTYGSLNMGNHAQINGSVATESNVNLNNNVTISYDSAILNKLGLTSTNYENYYLSAENF